MKKIINCTPHEINIIREDGNINIKPQEKPARVSTKRVVTGNINGITVNNVCFGEVENLPEEKEDTIIIVSRIVAEAVKRYRDDVVVVDETVRDEKGRVIGCKSFAVIY